MAGVATLGLLIPPARTVLTFEDARELLPALGQTARVVFLYGALIGSALALG